jgi:short-subunit dehydrogenase
MKINKALVTGGSTGIGLAICEHLLAQGVEVFSISRNPSKLLENTKVTQISLDLSETDLISSFAENFIFEHGSPDLLVNNAGYGAFYELANFPEQEIIRQTAVLFTSPVLLCKAFAPAMKKMKHGVIVNVTSLATLYPLPFMSLYNSNKSALSAFTHSMMLEYDQYPNWIDFRLGDILTGFNKSAPKQEKVLQNINMESAWKQIEKQLNESPLPHSVVRKLFQSISKGKKGTLYGGSFYHAHILSRIHSFIPQFIFIKLLRQYYFSVSE